MAVNAANRLQNLFEKITADETSITFKKMGADIEIRQIRDGWG